MIFPWIIYKGGQGGIPGGGGASWYWTEEEPEYAPQPAEYVSDCGNGTKLPFLGYCFDIVLDPLSVSILTQSRFSSANLYITVYQAQTKRLDYVYLSGNESTYDYLDDYPCLVQPKDVWNRGSVISLSTKQDQGNLDVYTLEFEGSKYLQPKGCFIDIDAMVRDLRGDAYIESLEIGEHYPALSGTIHFWKQNMLLLPCLCPGRLSSSLSPVLPNKGKSGGGGGSGEWESNEKFGVKLFGGVI